MAPEQNGNQESFTFEQALQFAEDEVNRMYLERPCDLTQPTRDRIEKEVAAISGRTPRYLDAKNPEGGIKINTPTTRSVLREFINRANEEPEIEK